MVSLPWETTTRTGSVDWSETDDLTLAQRTKSDRAAFGVLYDRYVDRIYGFCLSRLRDREVAEDATSQTFLKALAALQSQPIRGGSVKSWLFTIAYRVMIDAHRTTPITAPLIDAFDHADSGDGPESLAVASISGRELRDLVALLSPEQQDVIHLRLAGLTDQEIATVLGKRHGAIRSIQHRAVKQLRALYLQQSPETGEPT